MKNTGRTATCHWCRKPIERFEHGMGIDWFHRDSYGEPMGQTCDGTNVPRYAEPLEDTAEGDLDPGDPVEAAELTRRATGRAWSHAEKNSTYFDA